jgi:hypothetical protein
LKPNEIYRMRKDLIIHLHILLHFDYLQVVGRFICDQESLLVLWHCETYKKKKVAADP